MTEERIKVELERLHKSYGEDFDILYTGIMNDKHKEEIVWCRFKLLEWEEYSEIDTELYDVIDTVIEFECDIKRVGTWYKVERHLLKKVLDKIILFIEGYYSDYLNKVTFINDFKVEEINA